MCVSSFAYGQKALNTSITEGFKKPKAEMTFVKELIELGTVTKGEQKSFTFDFTNTGREAIEIEIVSACECSTLDWPIKPIKPGEKGKISVDFDSAKKDASETIDVDITLKNIDPKTGYQIFKIVQFSYELVD
jgi:peptidoglycan-associated lipoprotein